MITTALEQEIGRTEAALWRGNARRIWHAAPVRLDIDSLRALRAVANHGSFTSAANTLGMTQSAVSWKVKRLEERIGHELLHRDSRTIEPTEIGTDLLEHADRILAAHDAAVDALLARDLSGTIELGCNDEPEMTLIAGIIRSFRRDNPHVGVHTLMAPSRVLDDLSQSGGLDIALLQVLEPDLDDADVVIRRTKVGWFASKELQLNDDEPVPLITFGPNCFYRPLAEARLEANGRSHEVTVECENSAGVISAVEAGLGVAILNVDHRAAVSAGDHFTDLGLPDDLPDAVFIARLSNRAGPESKALHALLVDALIPSMSTA